MHILLLGILLAILAILSFFLGTIFGASEADTDAAAKLKMFKKVTGLTIREGIFYDTRREIEVNIDRNGLSDQVKIIPLVTGPRPNDDA